MKMYSTVASATIPLHVEYTCCFCEKENVDDDQYLALKAQSGGSLNPSPKQGDEARQRLSDKAAAISQDLAHGSYSSMHLTCACASCGRRQPWASFAKIPVWAIVLFGLAVAMALFLLANLENAIISPRLLILPAMAVPLIVYAVRNLITSMKISRLDQKYLPRVTLRKP